MTSWGLGASRASRFSEASASESLTSSSLTVLGLELESSVLPSSSPLYHIGWMTPLVELYEKVWLVWGVVVEALKHGVMVRGSGAGGLGSKVAQY